MVCKLLNLTHFNFPDYPVAEKLSFGHKAAWKCRECVSVYEARHQPLATNKQKQITSGKRKYIENWAAPRLLLAALWAAAGVPFLCTRCHRVPGMAAECSWWQSPANAFVWLIWLFDHFD